ncbi:pentapeptide repeat-containing protein [Marinobacterium rhizophilum]|uniref:pentapeptide repeat-containing protein n=1 Tax=Marinobacterium rhizophilum TaxID=420402 RepID=UPI00037E325E|nr:pentapeptide repeat-containing protein [Marinobacterium rhizophilum]
MPPRDDTKAAAIAARINELSHAARPVWFMLLGYFAFAIITLLGVEDADFFIDSRQTQLPIVNVSIPTSSFFLFAPALGTALFVYFHFQLLKLWEALSVPDARIDGKPLTEHVTPWLINDFGLWLRSDGSTGDRALSWLSNIIVFTLVFVAWPAALIVFWFRSFPAHDERTSLVIGAALVIALTALFQSILSAFSNLRLHRAYGGGRWHLVEVILITALALPIGTISWVATEDSREVWPISLFDRVAPSWMAAIRDSFTLWPTDLAEVDIVLRSAGFLEYDVHRSNFRVEWCRRQGLLMEICGPYVARDAATPLHVVDARKKWCLKWELPDDCKTYLNILNSDFDGAWRIERRAAINALESRNLREADLRNARLVLASLIGADLRRARLAGADLSGAQLEGADLRAAQLTGAKLTWAKLEDANLREADLEGAHLFEAALEGANLRAAKLNRADLRAARLAGAELRSAQLTGAALSWANLEGTDLRGATLMRANLQAAKLDGADLFETGLEGADLRAAQLAGAYINRAKFESTDVKAATFSGAALRSVNCIDMLNLVPDQIISAFGDGSVTLPDGWDWPTHWPRENLGEAFYGRWRYWREAQDLPWPPPGKALERLARFEAVAPE